MHLLFLLALGCAGRRVRNAQQQVILSPQDDAAWVALGDAYRRGLKDNRAREAYARALAINPDNAQAQEGLAGLSGGRNPRVVRQALRDPGNDELWGDAGDYYLSVGRRQEALSAYLYALRLDPADSEWQRSAASVGGIDQVIELLQTQATSDELLGDMGDLLIEQGRTEDACGLYRRALELDPSDSEWSQRVAACAGQDPGSPPGVGGIGLGSLPGPSGNAGSTIDALQGQLYGNSRLLTDLGLAHARAGDREKASDYLHSALLLEPSSSLALESYLAVTGRTRLQALEQLAEEMPTNDEVMGEMGDCMLDLGRVNEAKVWYRRALEQDPQDPEWQQKLSLLEAAGR